MCKVLGAEHLIIVYIPISIKYEAVRHILQIPAEILSIIFLPSLSASVRASSSRHCKLKKLFKNIKLRSEDKLIMGY